MSSTRRLAHHDDMNRYLIERTIPGAGALSDEEVRAIAVTSNGVLTDMAGRAQWVESYVTADAITCVYLADDEEALREHGRCGGFPVDGIRRIARVIDPMTAAIETGR
jgi:hypothetical protein